MIKKFFDWLLKSSLWMAGFGLMLASSGLDGAYMARWMPPSWGWLGFVLNTTAAISGMILTYFYGRLQQDGAKKRRLSNVLLAAEVVAVGYSWFFGWRQLLAVLPVVEPVDYRWVAPLAAGFIPLLLAFIGYAESLLAGKFDVPVDAAAKPLARQSAPVARQSAPVDKPALPVAQPVQIAAPPVPPVVQPVVSGKPLTLDQWRTIRAGLNGDAPVDAAGLNQWLTAHGYAEKPLTTARRWIEATQQEVANAN